MTEKSQANKFSSLSYIKSLTRIYFIFLYKLIEAWNSYKICEKSNKTVWIKLNNPNDILHETKIKIFERLHFAP